MGRNQARSRLHELQKFGRLKDDYGNAKYTKADGEVGMRYHPRL